MFASFCYILVFMVISYLAGRELQTILTDGETGENLMLFPVDSVLLCVLSFGIVIIQHNTTTTIAEGWVRED